MHYKTVALGQEMTKLHIFEVMKFSIFNLNYLKTNFCGHSTNQYLHDAIATKMFLDTIVHACMPSTLDVSQLQVGTGLFGKSTI